mmetsp:Transcript_131694/g.228175  ORF Transcript_131694/g.228175 Transcript_131694/m.228175 type:complete len:81 (-) Transcript_131694:62-304(-)
MIWHMHHKFVAAVSSMACALSTVSSMALSTGDQVVLPPASNCPARQPFCDVEGGELERCNPQFSSQSSVHLKGWVWEGGG